MAIIASSSIGIVRPRLSKQSRPYGVTGPAVVVDRNAFWYSRNRGEALKLRVAYYVEREEKGQ